MNLDTLEIDELWAFWSETNSVRPIRKARELFPGRPEGYVRATKDLGNYAANVATAQKLRLEGNIERAMMYEAIADRIYQELPLWARW